MSTNFFLYIFVLVAIVVALVVIKKVTSCLFKTLFMFAVVALLCFVYFCYLR